MGIIKLDGALLTRFIGVPNLRISIRCLAK